MALKKLAEVKFPDLIRFDREAMVEEMVYRMQLDPEWAELYDGYLYQNASQVVMNFFAYLFEKNAISANKLIRENFLNQAFSERAIYDNLKQMRINIVQNREATVKVTGIINGGYLTETLIIPQYFKLKATDLNDQPIFFELIPKNEDGTYNYIDATMVTPGVYARDNFELYAYSGVTFSTETIITDESLENFKLIVSNENIIEGSLQAYFMSTSGAMIKLLPTDTFLVEPVVMPESSAYFPNGVPHYVIRYGENGTAELLFGSADFGQAFDQSHINASIVVYGRSGGGAGDNITIRSIQTTEDIPISNNKSLNITFINFENGYGGSDRETSKQAKELGPYKFGREDGNIVDSIDAQRAMQTSVVKHEVFTPEYSDIDATIQLLHAHHKIVPIRDFSGLALPQVLSTDTLDSYLPRFLLAVNDFCNVSGAHDLAVTDEFVSEFVRQFDGDGAETFNFFYTLKQTKPISGSIVASAWNSYNRLVDTIQWKNNYTSDTIISAVSTTHATLTSCVFSTINMVVGINNVIKFQLDDSSYTFILTLPSGIKTAVELAADLQDSIIELITSDPEANSAFFEYIAFEFWTSSIINEDAGTYTLILRSPTVGLDSKITLLDNGLGNINPATDLYTLLQITTGIHRPLQESELVFLQSNYYPGTNQSLFMINNDLIEVDKAVEYDTAWDHDTSQESGTVVSLILNEENDDELMTLMTSTDITIEAYTGTLEGSHTLVDAMQFPNIQNTVTNGGKFDGGAHPVFDSLDLTDTNFDYTTSHIDVKLVDGEQKTIYKQSFPNISKIKIKQTNIETEQTNSMWDASNIVWTEEDTEWSQNIFLSTGPTVIVDIGSIVSGGLENGTDYRVKIYKTAGGIDTLMETIHFFDIVNVGGEGITYLGGGEGSHIEAGSNTITYSDTISTYYDAETKMITIRTIDATEDEEAPAYYAREATAEFDYLRILARRKSYEYITLDYQPNPYVPEGEAKSYISLLTGKSRRLIGLEHIIKTFNFTPLGENLVLYIDKNYSLTDAIALAEETIRNYFEYSNDNYEHTIGTKVNHTMLETALNREMVGSGLREVVFSTDSYTDGLTDATVANTYFFYFNQTMLDRLKRFEESYPAIAGIVNIFQITVSAVHK